MVFQEMGINGVVTAEGEDWKRQRRLVVTALNTNHLHRHFDVVRTSTERLHRRLKQAFSGCVNDYIAWLVFGLAVIGGALVLA